LLSGARTSASNFNYQARFRATRVGPIGRGALGDRYNLPHGEEVALVLIYVPGEEQPIDAGTP
jgi:hypothetical protein